MQKNRAKDPYAGKDKTAYEKIEDHSANVQTPGSEAEDNGVTVTVSDAYCDGYEMYFTMTATTDNEQINQKKYLLPEKSQRVQVDGVECGAELCLEKAEDGSFVGLGHISADFLKKKEFSDQSTVNIQFTQLYGKGENELSTTKYVEGENLISGEWSLKFTVNTDADGNALEKFGGTFTDPENGVYQIKMQFEQTDTDQIHVQVVDMDQSTNDNLVMVAEMTADLN